MEVCEILNILSDLDEFGAGQTPLQRRLELIREIQRVIPSAHVGGSIGLLLQGIDLGRDFTDSDIDFSISKPSGDFFPIIDVKRGDRFYQKKITMSSTEMDEADYFTDITKSKKFCAKIKQDAQSLTHVLTEKCNLASEYCDEFMTFLESKTIDNVYFSTAVEIYKAVSESISDFFTTYKISGEDNNNTPN